MRVIETKRGREGNWSDGKREGREEGREREREREKEIERVKLIESVTER